MQKLLTTNTHLSYRTPHSDFHAYLYGLRNELAIIDGEKTLIAMRRASYFIREIVRSQGHILFVNTNPAYNSIVAQMGSRTSQSYINSKWIGGLLSNWYSIHSNITHQKSTDLGLHMNQNAQTSSSLSSQLEAGHEVAKAGRKKGKMSRCLQGISTQHLPDCIITISPSLIAIKEAKQVQIPVISLLDFYVPNSTHKMITYPIPANVDSFQFVYLYCNLITKIIRHSQ